MNSESESEREINNSRKLNLVTDREYLKKKEEMSDNGNDFGDRLDDFSSILRT